MYITELELMKAKLQAEKKWNESELLKIVKRKRK